MGRLVSTLRICLIGFGEVGTTLFDDLTSRGVLAGAWDIQFPDGASEPSRAALERDIDRPANLAVATRGADLIISAVTAAQTIAAARACGRIRGAFYVDLNSASPLAKREAATIINEGGGRYVEAAVMSPIALKGIASPILLGGPHAQSWLAQALDLGFTGASVFSAEYGKAAAAKLCRSVIVKGVEALLTESLLSARHYGVEDTVLTSLGDLLPGADWPNLSRYMVSRAIEHGARRAEEMREAARAVEEAGVAPLMAKATAERQDDAPRFAPALAATELDAILDAMRALLPDAKP